MKKKTTSKNAENKFNPSAAAIEDFLFYLFDRGTTPPHWPLEVWDPQTKKWPIKFHQDKLDQATRILLVTRDENKMDVAQVINRETLQGLIHRVTSGCAVANKAYHGKYCLSQNQIQSLAKKLVNGGTKIDKWPEVIGFKTQPGIFFRRLGFDKATHEVSLDDIPTFKVIYNNMINAKAFCQRIASIYDPQADTQQMVFLLGKTSGGKSAILRFLYFLAGGKDAVANLGTHNYKSHGYQSLENKRVWIGHELKPSFFLNSKFKSLTGGDSVEVNPKHESAYSVLLKGIIFAASNEVPQLPADSALAQRIIICEQTPIPVADRLAPHLVDERLMQEAPLILKFCDQLALEMGASKRLSVDSTELIESMLEEEEIELQAMFDREFIYDASLTGQFAKVTSCQFHHIWERIAKNNADFVARNRVPGGGSRAKSKFCEHVKKIIGSKTLSRVIKKNNALARYVEKIKERCAPDKGDYPPGRLPL